MPASGEYLPFTGADIGVKKGFEFDGVTYFLRLRKNAQGNFYTMEVFDGDDNFVYSGPLRYRYAFGEQVSAGLPFTIIPFDFTELFNPLEAQTEITDENLGSTVRLYTSITIT